jgi:uncharacterized protein (DUF4213/DUF364 family)
MKIIDDLISSLNYESPVKDIRQGPFQTAVITRNCGLASTPHDPGPHHERAPVTDAGLLLEKDALALAYMANSLSPMESAIGMATINSLIEVDEKRCIELNAGDLLVRNGEGKKVAIIGHFPFVPRLRKVAEELWVIEKNPQEGDLGERESERYLAEGKQVSIRISIIEGQPKYELIIK